MRVSRLRLAGVCLSALLLVGCTSAPTPACSAALPRLHPTLPRLEQ